MEAVQQRFPNGTRIMKRFDVEGERVGFGGTVVRFEPAENPDDGTVNWCYKIHYDDGDIEHMDEAELATYVFPQ